MKLKEQPTMKEAADKPKYINVKMIKMEDSMEFTVHDFSNTKKEFYQFLSKYL